jgi:hypothetical protein
MVLTIVYTSDVVGQRRHCIGERMASLAVEEPGPARDPRKLRQGRREGRRGPFWRPVDALGEVPFECLDYAGSLALPLAPALALGVVRSCISPMHSGWGVLSEAWQPGGGAIRRRCRRCSILRRETPWWCRGQNLPMREKRGRSRSSRRLFPELGSGEKSAFASRKGQSRRRWPWQNCSNFIGASVPPEVIRLGRANVLLAATGIRSVLGSR